MIRPLLVGLLLVFLAPASALGAGPGTLRQYSAVEVLEIENKRNERGQKLPDEFVPGLREDLLYALVDLHLFQRVEDYLDAKVTAPQAERVLQMKVRIIGYSGAQNNASVTAMVHFIDKQSGQEVFQKRVDAKLHFDPGALSGALRKLVRSISNLVRESW